MPMSIFLMTPSVQWTQVLQDTSLKGKSSFLYIHCFCTVCTTVWCWSHSEQSAYSFCRCIRGLLGDHLVVLVTHQVQFALQADKILALKDVSLI